LKLSSPYDLRGSTGLPCYDCGRPHLEFSVDSVLWNRIMRPDGETDREYLCLACFHGHVARYIDDLIERLFRASLEKLRTGS
jgi:hypothetical protein